jgi:hypothetical protein
VNKSFVWGVVVGLAGTWAYHAFLRPLPGTKSGS